MRAQAKISNTFGSKAWSATTIINIFFGGIFNHYIRLY